MTDKKKDLLVILAAHDQDTEHAKAWWARNNTEAKKEVYEMIFRMCKSKVNDLSIVGRFALFGFCQLLLKCEGGEK